MPLRLAIPLFTLAFGLAGCALPPSFEAQRGEVHQLPPAQWDNPAPSEPVAHDWLASFNDATLVTLVDEALRANPDFAASTARLDAAIADARKAGALLFPTANLTLAGNKTSYLGDQPRGSFRENDVTRFGPSLDLSWEIDVWGRLRSGKKAVEALLAVNIETLRAARHSLAAQVAKSWFAAAEARLQTKLAAEFVKNYEETLRIVEARYRNGTVTQQDVATTKAELATVRQSQRALESAFQSSVRALEALLGRYPTNELQVLTEFQAVPPPVPAGLPSELLERRPDLVLAEQRLAAAYQISMQARAARLPRIALTSSLGSSSNSLAELVEPKNIAANFAGNLIAPLFDGGSRQAEFERATAEQQLAFAQYKSAALAAFLEVENALELETSLAQQESILLEATTNYAEASRIAEARYQKGATDLTSILTVQRLALAARRDLLRTQGQRLQQRVNLHLALGGNFGTNANASPTE